MEKKEFETEVLTKLNSVESLLINFMYPTTGGKEPKKASTCVEIPSPVVMTQQETYQSVISFAKDIYEYCIDKNQFKSILAKYTDSNITSIPFARLKAFVSELSFIPLKDAVISGREVPF